MDRIIIDLQLEKNKPLHFKFPFVLENDWKLIVLSFEKSLDYKFCDWCSKSSFIFKEGYFVEYFVQNFEKKKTIK